MAQLGFANATLFTRTHMRFLSLDGISFARPVPIGSILRLTSHITHSSATEEFPAVVVRQSLIPSPLFRRASPFARPLGASERMLISTWECYST